MFIPDSGSDLFPSRIRTISIPDPESASNTKKTKKRFSAQENMVRVFHPRSRIRMLNFYPSWIPDKGVKNQIRREKTFFLVFWYVTGILDGKNSDPGSKTNIPDPQHCKIYAQFSNQNQLTEGLGSSLEAFPLLKTGLGRYNSCDDVDDTEIGWLGVSLSNRSSSESESQSILKNK